MHDVYYVCFGITDLRSLTINIYIYICYKCLACESKMTAIFNSWQFSGLPTELPTISILESSGLPTELPTELPTISVCGSSGQPYLHGKIPIGSLWAALFTAHWAAHFFIFWSRWLPTELPTVSIYGSSGQPNFHGKIPMGSPIHCPLSCPLFPYMEVVGCLICMANFPWAAHGQPTPLPTCSPLAVKWAAAMFFRMRYQP